MRPRTPNLEDRDTATIYSADLGELTGAIDRAVRALPEHQREALIGWAQATVPGARGVALHNFIRSTVAAELRRVGQPGVRVEPVGETA